MSDARSTRKDLTTGSIWKKLVIFAIPLLISSLVQQLYNTVDLIFAGNLIDGNASAAIGASSMLVTCLVGFFGGMSVGAGVIIARAFGKHDQEELSRAIHSTIVLCCAGSAILMILGELLAPIFIQLLNTPEELVISAISYLRIYFISMPAIIFYNMCSGMLRSLGDSKSTLFAQAIGGLMNVLADWAFITTFRNGVAAVAWATLLSQSVSALYVLTRLRKLDSAYALNWKKVRLDKGVLFETLRIGIPAGLQALVITLSNVFAQYHINSLGAQSVAAFTAYFKVELLVYFPIVSLGQAMLTFTGQNYGAKRFDRIRKGLYQCLAIGIGLSVVISVFCLTFGQMLFHVFFKDAAIITLGRRILSVTMPFYFIYCLLQIPGDCLRGMGQSKLPMWIVIFNLCIIRTILLFLIVPRMPEVRSVAVCYPVTWALTGGCMVYCLARKMRAFKTV